MDDQRTDREILIDLKGELESVKDVLSKIQTVMEQTQTVVEKVSAEVMPTIDRLMKNPLIKMALGGKG